MTLTKGLTAISLASVALLHGCTCGTGPQPSDGGAQRDVFHVADTAPLDALDAQPMDTLRTPDTSDAISFDTPDSPPARLVLTVIDPTPCAPIPPLPRRARALPADSTPRVLWRRPSTDIGIGYIYDAGAIDPLGQLHISGVLRTHNAAVVDRDGAVVGVSGGFERDDYGPFGPMAILPSGQSLEWTVGGLRLDLRLSPEPVSVPVHFPELSRSDIETSFGVASTSGGFYASRPNGAGLRMYCYERDARPRLRWELSNATQGYLQVEADDSVWLSGIPASGGRAFRVSVDGEIVEYAELPDGRPISSIEFAGALRVGRVDSATMTEIVGIESGVERFRITRPSTSSSNSRVDPLGAVWVSNGTTATRYVDGVAASTFTRFGITFAEDGSSLLTDSTTGAETLQRILPDGSVAWTLPIGAWYRYVSMDIDGRVYLYGGDTITAVQTDVLPPNVRGCWQHRCNALANMSIAPYPG